MARMSILFAPELGDAVRDAAGRAGSTLRSGRLAEAVRAAGNNAAVIGC
jgi:hypothetical protein